jgi:glycosyltransferase involved in cell wall biosynthesis
VDNNIYPPTFGGSMRAFYLFRSLAREAEVSVICAVKRRDRAPQSERIEGIDLQRVKPYHPALFHYLERLRIAPLFLAHGVYGRWPGPLLPPESRSGDVWQIDSIALTSLFEHAPSGALKVYSSQNVEAEWFERVGAPLMARRRWGRRLESIERRAVECADLVLAVSDQDREGFLERYGAPAEKVHVIENGFDDEGLRPPTAEEKSQARRELGLEEGRQLLFAGSDFPHNRRAVDDLFTHLVGRLGQLDARLLVVGEISGRYRERARHEGGGRVRCLSARPDLLPVLWASDVGLNPVTTGAGSNVKVPTYLGAGLPVLSTPFGMRGYERLDALVSQAPVEQFADRLEGNLRYDPALTGPLAEYSWRSLGSRVAHLYRQRVSSNRSEPGGAARPNRAGEARCAS